MVHARALAAAAAVISTQVLLVSPSGQAQSGEDYSAWSVLSPRFESTGGGGIMIDGYDPVVTGDKCRTDFTATEPGAGGKVYYNTVEFDAVQA